MGTTAFGHEEEMGKKTPKTWAKKDPPKWAKNGQKMKFVLFSLKPKSSS